MSNKKIKYYVVWSGTVPGIYDSWAECQKHIHGIEGAKYKSFETKAEAEVAYKGKPGDFIQKNANGAKTTDKNKSGSKKGINYDSISVDAACSGNPGLMEYQGVNTKTKELIFHQGPFPLGTNNIGEFLAIVHALAFFKRQENNQTPIYTDSITAMGWVKKKKAKTNLVQNAKTKALYDLIERAEKWLEVNTYGNPILKWDTVNWGEIPADFGRK